jgi:hypothetical protein
MSGRSDRSRLATTPDGWWSLRLALLLSLVIASFAVVQVVAGGSGGPRWSAVASCVVPEGAAVRRMASTVDPSWCAASPVRRDDPRPPGSVVVAFVLPAEAGTAPRVRDVGVDPVGRQLFLAYDPAGDPVGSDRRVAVFVALMPDELPGESFSILDSSGAVQVLASR